MIRRRSKTAAGVASRPAAGAPRPRRSTGPGARARGARRPQPPRPAPRRRGQAARAAGPIAPSREVAAARRRGDRSRAAPSAAPPAGRGRPARRAGRAAANAAAPSPPDGGSQPTRAAPRRPRPPVRSRSPSPSSPARRPPVSSSSCRALRRAAKPNAPRIEIKDRDEELRRLGRTGLDQPRRRPAGIASGGPPSVRAGSARAAPPKKGWPPPARSCKQTADHHARRAQARRSAWRTPSRCPTSPRRWASRANEIIKKLWALGMMGVNINQNIDLRHRDAHRERVRLPDRVDRVQRGRGRSRGREGQDNAGGSAAARAGRHHHGPRRPRQDLAARRHPQGERRGRRGRRHHPAHRRLQGPRAIAATSSSWTPPATRRSPPCAPAAPR